MFVCAVELLVHEVLFVQNDEFERAQKTILFAFYFSNSIQDFSALGCPMNPLQNMKMDKRL